VGEEEAEEREREKRKTVVKGEFVKGATGRESDFWERGNFRAIFDDTIEIYNMYTYA